MDDVRLITDGACSGNPGPGGWGALLQCRGRERELSGGESETTNNRMELMAVIQGLDALSRSCRVTVVTDSRYVMDGVTRWMEGWKRKGWMTSGRKPVKNQDLWLMLDRALERHEVQWEWVRGHSGHEENERADELAKEAIPR